MAEQYTVTVRRPKHVEVYDGLLNVVGGGLDGTQLQRYQEAVPDAQIVGSTNLVLPLRNPAMQEAIGDVLNPFLEDRCEFDQRFSWMLLRANIAACLVRVSYNAISIRPLLPPTSGNRHFTNAAQRIYLSATLGAGGEMERSFGRAPIERLALPEDSAAPRAGRRFFVFPKLAASDNPDEIVARVVETAQKALVLTQDQNSADELVDRFNPAGFPVYKRDDIEGGFDGFKDTSSAICALANRDDGIDLPDESCRVVVLAGLPDADSLHERFLAQRARVGVALAQRVRTRVVQGLRALHPRPDRLGSDCPGRSGPSPTHSQAELP